MHELKAFNDQVIIEETRERMAGKLLVKTANEIGVSRHGVVRAVNESFVDANGNEVYTNIKPGNFVHFVPYKWSTIRWESKLFVVVKYEAVLGVEERSEPDDA